MNEEYYICDICDEDLEVTERWLIKVSIIDIDVDGVLIQRKLVFELIQEILENDDEVMKLGFEISKLPLYISSKESKLLKANGRFERLVYV